MFRRKRDEINSDCIRRAKATKSPNMLIAIPPLTDFGKYTWNTIDASLIAAHFCSFMFNYFRS
uniref:Uncharacterized protein n=1 Tax=Salix viminalis TaxID=40686 RepID=A0A6N2KG56_SALVM